MNNLSRILALVVIAAVIAGGAVYLVRGPHSPLVSRTVTTPATSTVTQKPLVFLTGATDLVTPLGKGYLFRNKTSGAGVYGDASGLKDISAQISLTADPSQSVLNGSQPVHNALINIEQLSDGSAVITTTKRVFIARSSTTIITLPHPQNDLDFTASAYDAATNSLFLISAYTKGVYRYDLGNSNAQPTILYGTQLEINRLAASGGKLVAYYDDVASTEPSALAEYAKTRQIQPLLIDAKTGHLIKTLAQFEPATFVAVSGSGKYLAIKQKLANTLNIYTIQDGAVTSLPRYDTGGAGWRGDLFYLARDQAVFTYDASTSASTLTKLAAVSAPVTSLSATAAGVIVSTNDDTAALLVPLATTQPPFSLTLPAAAPGSRYLYFTLPTEINHSAS